MKTLILSTAAAIAIGVTAVIPASAQSISIGGRDRGSDCRTVEKQKVRNGRTVITRERVCGDRYSDRRSYRDRDDDRYERSDRYVERRERRDDRPGIYIGR